MIHERVEEAAVNMEVSCKKEKDGTPYKSFSIEFVVPIPSSYFGNESPNLYLTRYGNFIRLKGLTDK